MPSFSTYFFYYEMLLSLSAENCLSKFFAAVVLSSKREKRDLIENYFCLLKFSLSTLLVVDVDFMSS